MRHFNGVIDLGPELFSSGDEMVICWKGSNYYRACNAFVKELEDGRRSHCIKRVNHPSDTHEDWDGNILNRWSFLRYFGWWNPKTEAEHYYTQGWNNGAITSQVLMILLVAALFLMSR
jgi:hypothetical protein